MKHIFVLNPKPLLQRSSLERIRVLIETIAKKAQLDYEIYISRYPRDAVAILKEKYKLSASGEQFRVYAVGGDGILFDCLNGVVGTNMELTCFPCGGANDFIRNFGENISVFKDVELLIGAVPLATDSFSCNVNYALNYCAIGIEGAASRLAGRFTALIQNKLSHVPNYLSAAYNVGSYFSFFNEKVRDQHYRLIIDDCDYSGIYAGIFVANGTCFGCNKIISLKAVPNDGFLNVVLIKSAHLLQLLFKWNGIQKGLSYRYPDICREIPAKKISISSRMGPLYVCLDGEVFRESSLQIEILPESVMFAAPAGLRYDKRDKTHEV